MAHKDKHRWLTKTEHFVDKSIPYLLIILLIIIILEFSYGNIEKYKFWTDIADWIIVGFFTVDLAFKYLSAKNIPDFLKRYWLDIIAVFPFFLLFRLFEEMGVLSFIMSEGAKESQKILHTGVVAEEELKVAGIVKSAKAGTEAQKAISISRATKLSRFIKPIFRLPRFAKAVAFYEHPRKRKNR